MKKHLLLFTLLLFMGFTQVGWGQILTFEFSALAGGEASALSNFNDANLTSSTITRGAGLTASANGGRFNATSWALTSIANAVSGNDYMEITITPNSGYQFSVSSIYVQLQRSATGPRAIALRSSVDNYAANLDQEYAITDVTTTQNFTFTFAQTNSSSAVTYRFYMWAEADGGTGGLGDGTGNDIVVNGTTSSVTASEPTTQSSTINFTSVGTNGFTINWTNGDGTSRIVLVKSGGAVDATPVDNTGYTANTIFSTGDQIGTGNYVVYSSSSNSVAITGLSASTTYYVAVYEYNGTGGGSNYFLTSPATGNQTTNAATGSTNSNIITSGNETSNLDYAAKQAATITATTDAVRVWSFTIQDGGGSTDDDALATELTDITIGKGVSNGVSSWTNTVREAALFDGTTKIAEVSVTGETISFTSMSGANVTASDNGSKTLDLYFTFETAVTDNIQYQFLVTSATANGTGSLFSAVDAGGASSSITGDANKIEVTATKLLFVQQPSTVNTNTSMSPAVTIEATDGNNIRDLDYATDINITSTGATLTGSPVASTPASGLSTFSSLTFTTAGTGATLTAASGSLTSGVSNSFNVVAGPVTHTLPYTDDFSYSTGQLTSAGSGANVSSGNWVNVSGTTGYIQVVSGNLTYTGYSTGNGNLITVSNSQAEDIRANFSAQSSDGTKLYSAFLISVTNTTGLTAGGDYFAHFSNVAGLTNPGFHARTFIRSSAGGFQFGVVANSTGTTLWTTTEYAIGTTYLLVVGYEFVSGATNNVARLWINPNISGAEPTADLISTSTAEPDLIDAFGIRQASATPNASIDAFYISNSWDGPLPVELTSFSALVQNKAVNLTWKTATEVNNYGFEIERVKDFGDKVSMVSVWEKVGFVNGAGNSNSPKEYNFTDKSATSGKYLYRLKQLDNDGQYTYSKEIEVDLGTPTAFVLEQNYPNPFNPTTSMQYSVSNKQFVTIKVFDMLGREVAILVNGEKEPGIYTAEFATTGLASGTYIYRMQAGEFVQTRKMIVLK